MILNTNVFNINICHRITLSGEVVIYISYGLIAYMWMLNANGALKDSKGKTFFLSDWPKLNLEIYWKSYLAFPDQVKYENGTISLNIQETLPRGTIFNSVARSMTSIILKLEGHSKSNPVFDCVILVK